VLVRIALPSIIWYPLPPGCFSSQNTPEESHWHRHKHRYHLQVWGPTNTQKLQVDFVLLLEPNLHMSLSAMSAALKVPHRGGRTAKPARLLVAQVVQRSVFSQLDLSFPSYYLHIM